MSCKNFKPEEIFSIILRLHTATGLAKINTNTKWKHYLYLTYNNFVYYSFAFFILVFYTDIYLVINDVEKLTENLCNSIIWTITIVKATVLLQKWNDFKKVEDNFNDNFNLQYVGSSNSDRELTANACKKFVKLAVMMYIMLFMVIASYIVIPLIKIPTDGRKFNVPVPFYTENKSPIFEILYLYISVLIFILSVNTATFDFILYGCMLRVAIHYDLLIKNIGILGKENDLGIIPYADKNKYNEEMEEKMKLHLIHHQAILRQCRKIGEIYSIPILVQLVGGSLLVAVIIYDSIVKFKERNIQILRPIFYGVIALYDIFFYCYYASLIETKSLELSNALYGSPWFDLNLKMRRRYLYMIASAQKTPKIKAGQFFTINLETYLRILNFSYALLQLLHRLQ